jgi:hypothetical protein
VANTCVLTKSKNNIAHVAFRSIVTVNLHLHGQMRKEAELHVLHSF